MRRLDVDVIVFDLDGTLIDSKLDIANSLNWTLEKMGYPALPMKTIEGFVGNGIGPLISRTVQEAGAPEREEEVFDVFRRRYWDHLLDNTRLFPGVAQTIEEFRGRYAMAVVSNKPERYTVKIVERLGLAPVMNGAVYGGDTLPRKKPDPAALMQIAEKYGAPTSRMVMVGDSAVDVLTGKNAGCATIGVTYGFRGTAELVEAGADMLIDEFGQLKDIL